MRNLRAKIAAVALLLAGASAASAQTAPNWTFGQVPTTAQWNAIFASKQDTLGFVPMNTAGGVFTGRVVTAAPGATLAGLNLTPGVAPSAPANGDLWTTTAGLFARINGATVGPLVSSVAGFFAATSPLSVSFPAGVTTYALTGVVQIGNGGLGATSFTAGLPIIGNGASNPTQGTRTGTTTMFVTGSGSYTDTNCLKSMGGNAVDAGAPCGVGSNVSYAQVFHSPDFTPGTTTSLTVSNAPLSSQSTSVTFDGIDQTPGDTWTLSGSTVTFAAPIPLNVQTVVIKSLTTTILPTWVVSINGATGNYTLPYVRTRDYVRAVLPGSDGVCDGSTDVTTQVNAAMAAAGAGRGVLVEGLCALSSSAFPMAGTRVFSYSNVSNGFVMTAGSTNNVGLLQIFHVTGDVQIDNLYFRGNAIARSGYGAGAILINVDAAATTDIANVVVQNSRFQGFAHGYYIWEVVSSQGATFTGTGSGTNLTVSAVASGTIVPGPGFLVTGTGVPASTVILSQTSGTTGGAGVYVTSAATTSSGATLTAYGMNSIAHTRVLNNHFDGYGVTQNDSGGHFIGIWGNLSAPNPTLSGTATDIVVQGNTAYGLDVCGFVEVLYGGLRGTIANNVAYGMGNNIPETRTCYTFNLYASAPAINTPKGWTVSGNVSIINHAIALYAAGAEEVSSSGNVFTQTFPSATAPTLPHGAALAFNGCVNCSSVGDILLDNYGGIFVATPDTKSSTITITNPNINSSVGQSGVTAQPPYGFAFSGTSTTDETAAINITGGSIQVTGSGADGVRFQGGKTGRFKMVGAQVSAANAAYVETAAYTGTSREFSNNTWSGALGASYAVQFWGSSTPLTITNETVDFSKQVSGTGGGYRAASETALTIRGLTLRNKTAGTHAFESIGSEGSITGVTFPGVTVTQTVAGSLGTAQPIFTSTLNTYVQNLTPSVVGTTPNSYWVRGWMNLGGSTWAPDRTGMF